MRNEEMVVWSYALTRAWRGARSLLSRHFFSEWMGEINVMWLDKKLRRVERYIAKARATS